MFRALVSLAAVGSVLACPQHDYNIRATGGLNKRADGPAAWTYAGSNVWGATESTNDTVCQNGMTQSPINLPDGKFSTTHAPEFAYSKPVAGTLSNWGYGPSFSVNKTNGDDYSGNPSFKFDDQTVYLLSWHTHAPSEHLIDGQRTRAELHLVHGDASGSPKGVLGLRINPGNTTSPFIDQFVSQIPGSDSTAKKQMDGIDMFLALQEVGEVKDFWTYKGSLTTPPCSEGLRWWVAGQVLEVSDKQMQALLSVSVYSTRVEQMVWNHDIGV